MASLRRSALVNYSAAEMYQLVNDIEKYPEFMGACKLAEVLSHAEDEIRGRLVLQKGRLRYEFTTKNTLLENTRIGMELIEGPFRYLQGEWLFTILDTHACKIEFHLEFEFLGSFADRAMSVVFEQVANSLVTAFCQRAVVVYGKR